MVKYMKQVISIIIPCYNTAKYVNKCIDSVLNNTFKDIEVILINDGSSDNTLEILKEYCSSACRNRSR